MLVPPSTISPSISALVSEARTLYEKCFAPLPTPTVTVAPGRVNLIGEHTDYTGGFVLPFAIDYSTVVYGQGSLKLQEGSSSSATASVRFSSCKKSKKAASRIDEFTLDLETSSPPETTEWTSYVLGTVYQYLPDLPRNQGAHLDLSFTISGNVPLGSGLSSSASLEVAVARFVESILDSGDEKYAFSSAPPDSFPEKVRALRCQKAENEWCHSPCGIMDQFVSSAASEGSFLLIDCRSLDFFKAKMGIKKQQGDNTISENPVVVVANSNVKHDIAGGEYPIRVAQCKTATEALAKVNNNIQMLRDATLADVDKAKDLLDDLHYRRAKHVVTENERTVQAKEALEAGDWKQVGKLMNASHDSMRDDYEVSCEEVDILVKLAQTYDPNNNDNKSPVVYGSRLTGGGFGGCTVTLVQKEHAKGLMAHLKNEYKSKTGKDCFCFETQPGTGARLLHLPAEG